MNQASSLFLFKDGVPGSCEDDLIVTLPVEYSRREIMLTSISRQLSFPEYFDGNWDALSDCLRDLSWIEAKNIILWHWCVPLSNRDELRIYLEVLIDCIWDWKKDEKHELIAIFPTSFQLEANSLLNKSGGFKPASEN